MAVDWTLMPHECAACLRALLLLGDVLSTPPGPFSPLLGLVFFTSLSVHFSKPLWLVTECITIVLSNSLTELFWI